MTDETTLRAEMLKAILANGVPAAQAVVDAEAAVRFVLDGASKEPPMRKGRARRDAVLDLWAAGTPVSEIEAATGVKTQSIRSAISLARRRGDARAVRRTNHSAEHRAALSAWGSRPREKVATP